MPSSCLFLAKGTCSYSHNKATSPDLKQSQDKVQEKQEVSEQRIKILHSIVNTLIELLSAKDKGKGTLN